MFLGERFHLQMEAPAGSATGHTRILFKRQLVGTALALARDVQSNRDCPHSRKRAFSLCLRENRIAPAFTIHGSLSYMGLERSLQPAAPYGVMNVEDFEELIDSQAGACVWPTRIHPRMGLTTLPAMVEGSTRGFRLKQAMAQHRRKAAASMG
jgi:hypothetical protein